MSISLQNLKIYLAELQHQYNEIYQEIYGAERLGLDVKAVRGCRDRLSNILEQIGDISGKKILDIGSNMGYFSLALADRGAYVISLEPDEKFRRIQNILASNLGLSQRIISLNLPLCTDSINFLKRNFAHFDIIIMLSLWHHFIGTDRWEKYSSLPIIGGLVRYIWQKKHLQTEVDKANTLCKQIFSLGEKIFFDTGQSDEQRCRHLHLLPDMGDNPGDWILNNIFGDDIYYNKKIIGHHIPHTSKKPRYLISANIKYNDTIEFSGAYESSPIDKKFKIDIKKQIVLGASEINKVGFCDENIMPYDCKTGENKFKFGGNLNDLLRAGASLDYRYIAKRIVQKVFDIHEKYNIAHNDLRLWNIIFSLPEYDIYIIDFERCKSLESGRDNDILMLRFILNHIARKRGTIGIDYPENIERFVKLSIGDYASECHTRQDFVKFIDSEKFYNISDK